MAKQQPLPLKEAKPSVPHRSNSKPFAFANDIAGTSGETCFKWVEGNWVGVVEDQVEVSPQQF